MSERRFFLVPIDPVYSPSDEQQDAFSDFFAKVCPCAEEIYRVAHEEPMLIGRGETSRIGCPCCGTELRLFTPEYEPTPYYRWWESAREVSGISAVEMPCCGQTARPLDLRLDPTDAYARFAVGALEPYFHDDHWDHAKDGPTPETLASFERILGHPVRQLWVYGT